MSEREPVPTWVKASLGVLAVAAVAVVLVLLLDGGKHGPGRHTSAPAGTSAPVPSAAAPADLSR